MSPLKYELRIVRDLDQRLHYLVWDNWSDRKHTELNSAYAVKHYIKKIQQELVEVSA